MKKTGRFTLSLYGPQTYGIGHFTSLKEWKAFLSASRFNAGQYSISVAQSLSPVERLIQDMGLENVGKTILITVEIEE